jgi:Rap1a immunity proteins
VRLLLATLLLLFLFATQAAIAQGVPSVPDKSGTSFYDECGTTDKDLGQRSTAENLQGTYCMGYVAGLTQGVASSELIHRVKPSERLFCLPEGVTNIQKVRVIRKYISNHPEEAHNPAQGQALMALREAFPCGK